MSYICIFVRVYSTSTICIRAEEVVAAIQILVAETTINRGRQTTCWLETSGIFVPSMELKILEVDCPGESSKYWLDEDVLLPCRALLSWHDTCS